MKRGVLFDFDGTLIDSQVLYDTAASNSLCTLNPKYTIEYCINYFNGRGWKDVFAEIEKLEPEKDVKQALNNALTRAKELTNNFAKPTKNTKEVLEFLTEKNYKKAICSNSSFATIKGHLQKFNLECYFKDEEIFSLESVKNAKPDPEIYLKAATFLNLSKNECIIVEDSMAGIKAANRAKIDVLLYTGATHHQKNIKFTQNIVETLKNVKDNNLKAVIKDLTELYNYL